MNIVKKIYYILGTVVSAVFTGGCSSMPMEDGVIVNQFAGLSFKYNWKKGMNTNAADSMYCLMNRVQYSHHYFVKTDNNGVVKCDNTPESAEDISDASLFESRFYVKPGEYYVCAIRKPYEGVVMDSLWNFVESTNVSFNDIVLRFEEVKKEDLPELKNKDGSVIKWISNQGDEYPYFRNISPMEFDLKKNFTINSNSTVDVDFNPGFITQKVIIPFTVHLKNGVEIENVLMEISGVVKERYLSKDVLIADNEGKNTGCVIVKPKLVSSTPDGEELYYEAEVNSFGLMPNKLINSSIGPGLMHLVIYGKVGNKVKPLNTTKNISRFLEESGSVEYNEMDNVYRVLNHELKLKTGFEFEITAERILSDTEDGIEEWEDDGNDIDGEA